MPAWVWGNKIQDATPSNNAPLRYGNMQAGILWGWVVCCNGLDATLVLNSHFTTACVWQK